MNRVAMSAKNDLKDIYYGAGDSDLLLWLRRGDLKAFNTIYWKYHAPLYTLAMRYIKSRPDVEDILQQVFVKLWTSREAVFITTSLKGYLSAMTKHAVMNYIRNSNNALQHNYRIVQQQPDYDDDLYMYAERNHLHDVLRMGISQLPPQQRIVARMRCEGYSNQEIAKKLNLSINTVNTHYRACVKNLKHLLDSFIKLIIIVVLLNFK